MAGLFISTKIVKSRALAEFGKKRKKGYDFPPPLKWAENNIKMLLWRIKYASFDVSVRTESPHGWNRAPASWGWILMWLLGLMVYMIQIGNTPGGGLLACPQSEFGKSYCHRRQPATPLVKILLQGEDSYSYLFWSEWVSISNHLRLILNTCLEHFTMLHHCVCDSLCQPLNVILRIP